jgi:tetratricopeptide (TPR) repeat protein
MLEMLSTINGHLDHLEARADPVVRVECFTCHRGSLRPRTLQASLLLAHEAGGIDSLVNAYNGLRTRWYGRAAFDFGEVALADVGGEIGSTRAGWADAERVHALNVEMNPSSNFARRQHVQVALARAFSESDAVGRARAATLRSEYGDAALAEPALNGVGYALLGAGEPTSAVAMFRYITEQHPESGNAFDSLGEGLVAAGDVAGAIAAYERSLALDPQNANARTKLAELRGRA